MPLGVFLYNLPLNSLIFVTGPQRCGSTIAAKILSIDLNRPYVDESQYNPDSLPANAVIQAPFANKSVLELSFKFPTAHFVFVERNHQDIVQSMERIEWYKDLIDHPSFYKSYVQHIYNYIELIKQTLPKERWSVLLYDSLKTHPLFITDRNEFTVRQSSKENPEGPTTWRNDGHTGSYKIRF